MSRAKDAAPRKRLHSKLKSGTEDTTDIPKEVKKRSCPAALHVSFTDDMQTVSIPGDQENPSDVWTVYSHVAYRTKREQRFLKRSLQARIHETIIHCSNIFPLMNKNQGGQQTVPVSYTDKHINGSLLAALEAQGYGKSIAASAIYALSVWPSLPVKRRPPMSSKVQRAFEAVQAGTCLYVFNEKPNSPLRCGTALRLLHSVEGDEASVAIFNSAEATVIDGYIPLSFVVSLSFGLEPVERDRHLKANGMVTCNDGDRKKEETSNRAFTLHCAAPERFYVTFIAATQEDFNMWTRVIDYFVLLNSCCRTYMLLR